MKRSSLLYRLLCLLLTALLLAGCAGAPAETVPTETEAPTTLPQPTAPPDGNPNDVTCKGSYTGSQDPAKVVATLGDARLTSGMLQAFYELEVTSWYRSGASTMPDWNQGLDTQLCTLEGENVTWQQYFLRRALGDWHSFQALVLDSAGWVMPLDPEYKPYAGNFEKYMSESMPAVAYLYGHDPSYKVNSMHQAFIDSLPEILPGASADMLAAAELMNYAYAYYSVRHFFTQVTDEEITEAAAQYTDQTEETVSFRHVLTADEETARGLLEEFYKTRKKDEPRFAVIANTNSLDAGTQLDGGRYVQVGRGVLPQSLEDWLFDETRQSGDTTVLQTELGFHAVYFSSREALSATLGRQQVWLDKDTELIRSLREGSPMTVSYSDIVLEAVDPTKGIGFDEALYPDIAHENLPDVPLYIQQDYTEAKYGAFPLVGWGCGITTLAMFASFMADEYLTPPLLAARYGAYCHQTGTDAALISDSAPELGYFVLKSSYDWKEVNAYMEQGYHAICLQHKGYFTRGGHYLVLRGLNEDGTVSIRDSNLYNYGKLAPHKDDHFSWNRIIPSGVNYWVFQNKITRIPACSRCGEGRCEGQLVADYLCHKCLTALTRRDDFLAACPGIG